MDHTQRLQSGLPGDFFRIFFVPSVLGQNQIYSAEMFWGLDELAAQLICEINQNGTCDVCWVLCYGDAVTSRRTLHSLLTLFPPSLPLSHCLGQAETLSFRGTLKGHVGWVTAIATGSGADSLNTVVSCSRDKSLIVWNLTRDGETYGVPHRRMNGYGCLTPHLFVLRTPFLVGIVCDLAPTILEM